MSTVHLGREGDRMWLSCHLIGKTWAQPITSAKIASERERKDEAYQNHQLIKNFLPLSSTALLGLDGNCHSHCPVSQEPPTYLTHINTLNSYNTPSRKTIASILYWCLSWAQRAKVIGHDHTVFRKVEIQTQIYLNS